MSMQSKWIFTAMKPGADNWLIWTSSLVLLAGLYVGQWNPMVVVFGYFLETIVIGLIHVAKMWSVMRFGKAQQAAVFTERNKAFTGVFGIVFFLVHYFFFVYGQSVFVFSFFGQKELGFESSFHVFKNYYLLLQRPDMQLVFGIIAATQLGSVVMYFFIPRKYDKYTMDQMFIQPYLRIFVQQVATILTGFVMLVLGGPAATAVLLILVRLVLDCILTAAQHNQALRMAFQKAILKKEGPEAESNASKLMEVWLDK